MQSENNKLVSLIPTRYPSVYEIKLNLFMQTRYIGTLDTAGDGTFLTKRKTGHVFHKYGGEQGSLGINHQLLTNESIPFKWIVIDFANHKLVTSRLYMLTHGKCFKFGAQGFELQCFLPLNHFGLNKVREFESRQTIQENLFAEVI